MTRPVEYAKRAQNQLQSLFEHVASSSGERIGRRFVGSIVAYCEGLAHFPERGLRRDDLRPRLRLVGFRRKVTIAFRVDPNAVRILGVFYGGQDVEAALEDETPPDE